LQGKIKNFGISAHYQAVVFSVVDDFCLPITGAVPPAQYPVLPEIEDTPRTYRSDWDGKEVTKVDPDASPVSTEMTFEALTTTFQFFKKAVVS
jgi:hypothetical protein